MQRRALVVDDDPSVCEFIHGVLSANGMEALTLTESGEASTYLRKEKFSLALFDLCMPMPDGVELTRRTRNSGLNQRTPIIMVSDDQGPKAVSLAFAAGASFFLYKPIDKVRLLKLIAATQGAIEHERRRFRRVELRSRVELSFEKQELIGETIDISLDGMLVTGPRSFPLGSTVRINLELASGVKPIVGVGSVVRILSNNRMGIQLNQLTVTESGRLQDFLLPLIARQGQHELPVNVSQVS